MSSPGPWPQLEVELISETYEYVPTKGQDGFLKVERVRARTTYDGLQDREILYHRHSFRDSVSANYEVIYELPFGAKCVSGAA